MKHIILVALALFYAFSVSAQTVKVSVASKSIPTYEEPELEALPMFAENRVHQRTSGNPYPNKVVLKVNRKRKIDKNYTIITLENDYLEIQILPELGGKIFAAKDKVNGYNFFYNQHVIKPALIGALGSWTSGGLEFNWPIHHRPSAYMPVDYEVEKLANGGAIVWMAEHEPMDRMKGMVGIVLNPGESIFETRVRLSNITSLRRSFLWWENAAVPSNKDYQIFFPHDVSHVFFHYKKAVTTYPIASDATGTYNGIKFDKEVDISQHKNTKQPTSYFSAASDFDFFGGYDAGKKAGVVHVGDHHVSPGKKMFTWAYNQLSTSWENALTDTDGAYCELMAGSYSDNQPDFSWLEPLETKTFSQYWFPIGALGVPDFANTAGAIYCKDTIRLQLNKHSNVQITIEDSGKILFSEKARLKTREIFTLNTGIKMINGYSIHITAEDGTKLMTYQVKAYDKFNVPHIREDRPNFKVTSSPYKLYLEGVHVDQYRDPATKGISYYKEAIKREPDFAPALIGLGEYYLDKAFYAKALDYLLRGEKVETQFNKHPEDGKLYYLLGQTYMAVNNYEAAYDYLQKAAWNEAYVSAAMTYIGIIDMRNGEYDKAIQHLNNSTRHNINNDIANALKLYVLYLLGDKNASEAQLQYINTHDKLNHLARYFGVLTGKINKAEFLNAINTDRNQVCLDIVETLLTGGLKKEARSLLEILQEQEPLCFSLSAILADLNGGVPSNTATEGIAFPSRQIEMASLSKWSDKGNAKAKFLLACALYDKGHYNDAAALWVDLSDHDYRAARNLAIAYYSHLNRKQEVLPLLKKALKLKPNDEQLIFEIVYVMGKMGIAPSERLSFLDSHKPAITRDDILLEWARAYNMAGQQDQAIALLTEHTFIPSEGGEHAVAEQYMMAYLMKGRKLMQQNKMKDAALCFKTAQTLPQNLGAGLWNNVKLVPYKYYEGICLKALGQIEQANENFKFITDMEVDYFSNMSGPELPYYQALCFREMGSELKGNMLINYTLQKWKSGLEVIDPGYFSTTPFFISYLEDGKQQRTAYYSYLLSLAYKYIGNKGLEEKYINLASKNDPYSLNIFEAQQVIE